MVMTTDSEVADVAWDVGSVVAQAHSMNPGNKRATLKAMCFLIIDFLKGCLDQNTRLDPRLRLGLLPEPKSANEGVGVSAQTGARW